MVVMMGSSLFDSWSYLGMAQGSTQRDRLQAWPQYVRQKPDIELREVGNGFTIRIRGSRLRQRQTKLEHIQRDPAGNEIKQKPAFIVRRPSSQETRTFEGVADRNQLGLVLMRLLNERDKWQAE